MEQGASLSQARVLSRLHDKGPARVTELARALQVSQPTMSALVQRLAGQGSVRRSPDAGDGRATVVELAPAGVDLLTALRASRADFLGAALAQLTAPERDAVERALPALQRLADLLEPAALPEPAATGRRAASAVGGRP